MSNHRFAAGLAALVLTVSVSAVPAAPSQVSSARIDGVTVIKTGRELLGRLIFAGSKLGKPVEIGSAWQDVTYSAVCPLNDADAFVQINLGSATGQLRIQSLTLTETGDKSSKTLLQTDFSSPSWRQDWKLLDARVTGVNSRTHRQSLEITVPKRTEFPWDVQLCSRKIRLTAGCRYTVSFRIQADTAITTWPITSYLMRMNPLRFYATAGEDVFLSTATRAVAAGVNVISPLVTLPWPENPADYTTELALAGVYLDQLAAVLPKADWMLRIGVEPPAWWVKANPGEMQRWENGRTANYVCIASESWRQAVREHLSRLIPLLEKRWGNRIVAYIPVAQSTGEWYYPIWNHDDWGSMNHSPSFRRGYQRFLKNQYSSLADLNLAWKTAYPDFAAINVPSGADRRQADLFPFRNPATQQSLYDFDNYQQTAMREALENAAAAIKAAAGSAKPVIAFYGYTFELPGCKEGIGPSGHLQLGRLLRSPCLDGVVDITSYFDRGTRGTGALMTPVDSITAHGKFLFTEDDSRTHLSAANAGYERTATAAETRWAQTRNLVRSLVHHGYTWKFDLYGGGWYNDASLWQSLAAVAQADARLPLRPFSSDVAVIIDEKSFLSLRPGIDLTRPLIYEFRSIIGRSGLGEPSWWLLEDAAAGKVPPHRLTIFLNAFYLNAEEKKNIGDFCRKNGGTVLWMYAPGYLDEHGEDFTGMTRLTGFRFKRFKLPPKSSRQIVIADPAAKTHSTLTLPNQIDNYFTVLPDGVEVLGKFADGHPALARANSAGYTSVFCAAPKLTPEFLAGLGRTAGTWNYTSPGNIVITDGRLFSLTALKEGIVTIRLPQKRKISTVDGHIVSIATDRFDVNLKSGETRVFVLTAP